MKLFFFTILLAALLVQVAGLDLIAVVALLWVSHLLRYISDVIE